MKGFLVIASLLGTVLALSACGGSSSGQERSSSAERPDPAAAARKFIAAIAAEDAEAFCRLTLPTIREPNFATAGVAKSGSCEERAEEMFEYRRPGDSKPFWALLGQAKLASVDLRCKPETDRCPTATAMLENLPARDGTTTSAPLALTFEDGRWLVGTSTP